MSGLPKGRVLSILVVLGVFVLLTVLYEVRHSFEQALRADLVRSVDSGFNGHIEIGSVDLSLLLGTVAFRQVRVLFPMGKNGQTWRPLFFFPEVDGHVSLLSLLNRIYDFQDLTFQHPLVTAYVQGDTDNYRGFLEKWRSGIRPSGEGGATVRSFRVNDARIEWGPDLKTPLVVLKKLEGSVDSNLLMDRFRVRFSSPTLTLQTRSGVVHIDGFRFAGNVERGSLRDFRFELSMKPSWFWIKGNVTRIQDRPFLDLFFHGKIDLSVIAPLLGGKPKGFSGNLRTDGYIHGPIHHWNGNVLVQGGDLTVSGKRYRSVSLRARFAPERLHIQPFSAVLSNEGAISASLIANLSTKAPVARIKIRQDRRSPSILGDIPVQVTVTRTVRLPRRENVLDEWLELVGKVLGPSVS
ncbi:MAG: hypothetical protein ACYCYP_08455 [Leptospirales bacterium]